MFSPNLCAVLFLLFVFGTSTCLAQDEDPKHSDTDHPAKLAITTQRVVIFKDGYCLIVKEATGTTDEHGHVVTQDVPDAAVLGSFWAIPQQGDLRAMVSGWVDVKEEEQVAAEAADTIELVEANVGAKCSVTIDENTKLSGTILKVLGPNATRATPTPESPLSSVIVAQPSNSKFLLRTEAGDVMIDANSIRLLTIAEMKTAIDRKTTRQQRKKQMRFEFGKPNQDVKLTIMYFRPGVRWIPTYRIDLAKQGEGKGNHQDGTVRLSLQGEIINEAEDLMDVPMDIVVGVPNFRFRSVASPLVLERVLRNALAQAAPQLRSQLAGNNQMFNNYISNSRMPETSVDESAESGDVALPTELTTKSGNDLFVYSLAKMSLRKGDRASIPILSTEVPFRNVYTWDATVKHTETIAENSGNSPLAVTENNVWRQIEVSNTTNIPWTTGAAMIVDGFQPLAQELLTYTPSGSKVRIPVTVAVDVRGRVRDQEVNRELDSLRFARNVYAKVTGQIEATVKNHKKTPVDVEISLRFGGKPQKVSDGGTSRSSHFRAEDWHNYRGDPAVNSSTRTTWTTTIKPGASFAPRVDYHFYTRH